MNTLTMKQTVIASTIAMSILTTPLMANEAEHIASAVKTHEEKVDNENIGFGTGAIIGGIVAGPLGAIFAGVTGIFIAKHINVTDDVEVLSAELVSANSDIKNQQDNIVQYQTKLAGALQRHEKEMSLVKQQQNHTGLSEELHAENLLMSLQFSSGSSEISAHYQEQVSALAQVLNDSPQIKLELSGYTDLAGDKETNYQLSLARVESVKALLLAQGVNDNQITGHAYGETAPIAATQEHEINFYDRRVVLKIHNPVNQMAKR
jgi:sortase system peptidoglycan-associated protein